MVPFDLVGFTDTLVITAPVYDPNDISGGGPTYPPANARTYKGSIYPPTSLGMDVMTAVQQRLGTKADYVLDLPPQPGNPTSPIAGPNVQVVWSNSIPSKTLMSLAEAEPDVRDQSGQPILWRTWLRLTT